MSHGLIYQAAAKTDTGLKRQQNEDDLVVGVQLDQKRWQAVMNGEEIMAGSRGALFIVADGMGGTNGGEIASKLSVSAFRQLFDSMQLMERTEPFFRKSLYEGLLNGHRDILDYAKKHNSVSEMGTTCVAAWLFENNLFVAWVGDSRAYLYSEAGGLMPLSKDHSYVQELIDAGRITEAEAFTHKDRNIITQSLGDRRNKPSPGFSHHLVKPGDLILLCSDGLNTMLPDADIKAILSANPNPGYAANELVDAANRSGGADNITVCKVVAVPANASPIDSGVTTAKPVPPGGTQAVAVKPVEAGGKVNISLLRILLVGVLLGAALIAVAWYFIFRTKPPAATKVETEKVETPAKLAQKEEETTSPSNTNNSSTGYILPTEITVEPEVEDKELTEPTKPTKPASGTGKKPETGGGQEPSQVTKNDITVQNKALEDGKYYISVNCYNENNLKGAEEEVKKLKSNTPNTQPVIVQFTGSDCGVCKYYVLLLRGQGYSNKKSAEDVNQKIGGKGKPVMPCK